jgi:dienelactone hydrolase
MRSFLKQTRGVTMNMPETKKSCRSYSLGRGLLFKVSTIYFLVVGLGLAEQSPVPELWGNLPPGPFRVGFRRIFRFDPSRTWHVTRDYTGAYTPDRGGRPLQLNVWYPVGSATRGNQMTVRDYVNQVAPEPFSELNDVMQKRNRESTASCVAPTQLDRLMSTPVPALLEAPPAVGRFPTVIYVGGLNADLNSNFILAEFLASHGFFVASLSMLGQTDQVRSLGRSPADIEVVVRDIEFALGVLNENPSVDLSRLGVIGHSMGGVEAAVLGLRNGNISALVGLDGTYGFKGSEEVLTNTYGYSPVRMRAAFLDLRRAQGEQQADLDLEPVMSFRYADRSFVTLRNMHHSDFTSFAMIASRFDVPINSEYATTAWNRATERQGFENVCQIVRAFLDQNVNGHNGSSSAFAQSIERAKGSSFRHVAASCAAPSPLECIELARQKGMDGLHSIFAKSTGEQPPGSCVDLGLFNTYGYELLGQHLTNQALVVFEIAAWAHPESANAQDSLADGLFAVGQKEQAKAAIRRAIALAPEDPAIGTDSRNRFITEEEQRLNQSR